MISYYVLVIALVIIIVSFADISKPKNYPPGPRWWPIFGNFLGFRWKLARCVYHHIVWQQLAGCYNTTVVGLKMGRDRVVAAIGADAVRAVLTRDEFNGRPDGYLFRLRTYGQRLGIVFCDGHRWKVQRKFSLHQLHHFGYGRRTMEEHIAAETAELVQMLRHRGATGASSVDMEYVFDVPVLNVLWQMLAGQRFSGDDHRMRILISIVHDVFKAIDMSGGVLNQLPFLRHIAPDMCGYTLTVDVTRRMTDFFQETIAEHKRTLCSENPRDLMDAFLLQLNSNAINENDTFTETQLMALCLDLFMAGSETTSNTLCFSMLYMLRFPVVQRKVQDELDLVVGRNRLPTLADRSKLKYTEAVLMEVQRCSNVPPLGIAHRAVQDTVLQGYRIPCDTIILTSLYSVHMDATYWSEPNQFRPERFLDPTTGNVQQHEDHFIPFGTGKRRCLGESLAKASYFLFFTTICHSFHVQPVPKESPPTLEPRDGLTLSPEPYRARFVPREIS